MRQTTPGRGADARPSLRKGLMLALDPASVVSVRMEGKAGCSAGLPCPRYILVGRLGLRLSVAVAAAGGVLPVVVSSTLFWPFSAPDPSSSTTSSLYLPFGQPAVGAEKLKLAVFMGPARFNVVGTTIRRGADASVIHSIHAGFGAVSSHERSYPCPVPLPASHAASA